MTGVVGEHRDQCAIGVVSSQQRHLMVDGAFGSLAKSRPLPGVHQSSVDGEVQGSAPDGQSTESAFVDGIGGDLHQLFDEFRFVISQMFGVSFRKIGQNVGSEASQPRSLMRMTG